jgi:hypothetical protein
MNLSRTFDKPDSSADAFVDQVSRAVPTPTLRLAAGAVGLWLNVRPRFI